MLRAVISGSILAISLFSLQALAVERKAGLETDSVKIIKEYKILRNACAQTTGNARKACFAKLESKNEAYSKAKKKLLSESDNNNVRLVSFSD